MNDMGQSGPKRRREPPGKLPGSSRQRKTVSPSAADSEVGEGKSSASGEANHRDGAGSGQVMKRAFTIPSDFNASRDVQVKVMQDVSAAGFDEETIFAIRISLEEAIVNAIRHGNRLDASKQVRVESKVSPGQCEIVVEDEGTGFERKRIPDPTSAENLCRPNGRGILLIESYMTNVRWERGGRRVWMVKRAAPVARV
jgi:serine/threonine-protein kinase RsbW